MAEEIIPASLSVRRGVQRLARQLRFHRSDHEISGTKRSVLGTLFRSGKPITASELARLEHLQPQSLTRVVADLEDDELIQRNQDESDRRQLLISITETGKNLLIVDAQSQTQWLNSVMSLHLSQAERDILVVAAGLMDRICDASEAQDRLDSAALESGSSSPSPTSA